MEGQGQTFNSNTETKGPKTGKRMSGLEKGM